MTAGLANDLSGTREQKQGFVWGNSTLKLHASMTQALPK